LPNLFIALPAHRLAADGTSLIGCTSYDLTNNWSQPMPISLLIWVHFLSNQIDCYWHCSDESVHYKYDKTVNFLAVLDVQQHHL